MKYGMFDGEPEILRKSSVLRRCVDMGIPSVVADEIERVHAEHPACPHHGKLDDPILGITDSAIAIICPWCSGPTILEAWEAEGRRGVG